MIETIKKKLMGKLRMTDMSDVSLVLGMQVTRDREQGTLTIIQENYTKSVLDRFGMGSCNPLSTPGFGSELSVEQPEETPLNAEDKQRYQIQPARSGHVDPCEYPHGSGEAPSPPSF